MCLKEAPDKTAVAALQKAILGREVVRAVGRHAYIVYPDGIRSIASDDGVDREEAGHPRHRPQLEHGHEARRARQTGMSERRRRRR